MFKQFPWLYYANDLNQQHQTALIDEKGRAYTWQQLVLLINSVADHFSQQGVSIQSGVALCGKNSFELLLAYLALLQLGARVLPVNPAFNTDKIKQIAQQSAVNFSLFLPNDKLTLPHLVSLDYFQATFEAHTLEVIAPFSANRPATMTLTSGSTGNPKAVVHSIQAHLANAKGVCQLMGFDHSKSWLLSLPLYHVSGQGIIWRWLLTGAQLHLPTQDFNQAVLNSTHASLVPTQLQRLLDYIQQHNITEYNTSAILLGGTQIPLELTQQLTKLGICSYSGYGMTEMASTVCAKISDDKTGVGQPLLGRELRLVNDEIWIKGAGLALGYWLNDRIVPLVNEQGWLQSKDKGQWIDGELVILGRMDNMFISGGENIQPEEIEAVLQQCEWVKQAFVLPVADQEFGYRPVAFVEFSQPFSIALSNQLQHWLLDKIERFKQPITYFPLEMEKWQKQGTIKISRALLKAELTHFWKD